MKVHPIPHAIFETTRSGFIQILHHCSVLWKVNLLYFVAQTLYTLNKKSPSKRNFQTFECFQTFTKLLMSYLKTQESFSCKRCHIHHVIFRLQVNFSSNFASLFSVIKHNSSKLFEVERYVFCTKGTNQSGNLRILSVQYKSVFFEIYITLQCHERKLFCTFLAETL